ncbi:MAG TPA: 3-dehydroquinate synthase, partial [Chromatiaceae bacterium]|nr:3-dehydroquinate synthase [Chromatiaceae bacterium]
SGSGESVVMIGERLENLKRYLPAQPPIIITDSNVRDIWGASFPPGPVITIGTGERIKTFDTLGYIYDQLIALEADRSSFIVGIGGGIVCDIAGFVASTYMRGVRFGFVSTTLLSQVDASVGGKNGVNFKGYKNIVGVFNQPQFVVCDLNVLRTLPREELRCGFAEIVKHGAIADKNMFEYLERHYRRALALDLDIIAKLVYDSVAIKSSIVNQDAREKGVRRKLNFGHTFGHAIEKTLQVRHGEAVSAGMALAAGLSVKRGFLQGPDAARIAGLLEKYELPLRLPHDGHRVLAAIRMDKKREGNGIRFVLLREIGRAFVAEVPFEELEAFLT